MLIRIATDRDRDDVHRIHLSAFPEDEREIVSQLAVDLLAEATTPPVLSFVAEAEGAVVGHAAFSPLTIADHTTLQGYILAPLAVRPAFQKHRIGSLLVKTGMQRLSGMGVGLLFVYGDPGYYGRFGFRVEAAKRYMPPYPVRYPSGWQAVALKRDGSRGPPVRLTCVSSLCQPMLW